MRVIMTMITAGLSKNKFQSVVFTICCVLCSSFLLSAFVLNCTIQSSFDMAYESLEAPNISIRIEETEVEQGALENFIKGLPYVESYSISKCYLASNVKLPNRQMNFAFLAVSKDKEAEKGTVIVNNAVYGTKEGDEAELSINGKTVCLKISDMVTDPINCAPESMIPYFWMNESEIWQLTEGFKKGSYLLEAKVKQEDGIAERLMEDYEKYFNHPFTGALTTYEDIRHSYLFRYEIFGEFFLFLCIFLFVIISIITILLSQMAVYADMKKIGVLKAIGFTDSRINIIYILQYLILAIVAGVVGVIAAGILLRTWLSGMFVYIDRDLFRIKNLWQYQLLTLVIMLLIICMVVCCSITKIIRVSAIDAINLRKKKKHHWKSEVFTPTPKALLFNLGLIKCMQRKLESAFVFVLALGMGLLYLTSFYIIDGVNKANDHLEEWGIVEMDVYVSRKSNADEKESGLLEVLDKDAAVDFYYAALSDNINYRLSGSSIVHSVVGDVYDGSIPEKLEYIFTEGRNPQLYDEVAVGFNFAQENKLTIGDSIFVIRNGEETELEIVGIYPAFKEYANSIRFLTKDIQQFFGNQANGYYSIVLKDGESVNLFAQRMSEEFEEFDFFPMERSTVRSVKMLLPPLAVCMVLFTFIFVMIMICITGLMVIECRNELDIYGSIGFSRKKIKAMIRWRFILPILLGMLGAIPLSVYGMPQWMSPLINRLGLIRLPIYPKLSLIAVVLTGVLLGSCFVTTVPLNKVKKIRQTKKTNINEKSS